MSTLPTLATVWRKRAARLNAQREADALPDVMSEQEACALCHTRKAPTALFGEYVGERIRRVRLCPTCAQARSTFFSLLGAHEQSSAAPNRAARRSYVQAQYRSIYHTRRWVISGKKFNKREAA